MMGALHHGDRIGLVPFQLFPAIGSFLQSCGDTGRRWSAHAVRYVETALERPLYPPSVRMGEILRECIQVVSSSLRARVSRS